MESSISTCPRCGAALEAGFMAKAAGLSWVSPNKFESVVFLDEDISQAGLKKFLPSKAEYFRSYLCQACKLYLVDYSEAISYAQAKDAAASFQKQ